MRPGIPEFETIEQIAEFWDAHDFSDYIDDTEPVEIEVNLRNRPASGRIPILEQSTEVCPLEGSELLRVSIDYTGWSNGRLLVIRRVPILVCDAHSHRFILPQAAKEIEKTFERDQRGELEPEETMLVPVVTLKMAA